jgi:hypothetical protein
MADNRAMLKPSRAVWFAPAVAVAVMALAKDFTPPPAQPAISYALHETHAKDHLTVGVDPYDSPAKLSGTKVKYLDHGLLPLRVIFTNEGDAPVVLTGLQVELITAAQDKIPPATMDDLMRRLGHPDKTPTPGIRTNPLPFPLPKGAPPRVKSDQVDEIESLMFRARAVGPHETMSGFLFFDVQGLNDPLHNAKLYVHDLLDPDGKELMYFEIPMKSTK